MATATSLTLERIQDLMAGWEGVALSQEAIDAAIAQLRIELAQNTLNLTQFNDVILPQLQADLAAGSILVSELNDTTLPNHQLELDAHALDLENLNTVFIPGLQTQLDSNADWILELDGTTLPALYAQLDANDAVMNEFNTVTLPDLQSRLTAVEAGAGFDPTELNAAIDALEASMGTLNDTTLPALNTRLTDAENAVAAIDISALESGLDAASAAVATLEGKFPIAAADIEANTITANEIATDAITANEIAADAVTASEILANTITANEIAGHTITAEEILANTITANEIAGHTITADEIAADTITANEIAGQTITAAEIAADTITANEIATDAITANEIAGHTITAAEIFAGTITATEIAGDTITANEIAADAITASEIAGHTITAAEIAGHTITADEIAGHTITAAEIFAGTITATEIASGAIIADKIDSGAITSDKIDAGAVIADKIDSGAITTDKLDAGAVTAEKVSSEIIIANELYSQEGYFGVIEAGQISSGSIDAEIGLLGSLQVGEISIDQENGISVPGPQGPTLISSTGVGHRFAGAIDTDELTVAGGLTLNAENNTINGALNLANVVVPPTDKPSVSVYWPSSPPIGADTWGLTDSHDGNYWVAAYVPNHTVRTYLKGGDTLHDFQYDPPAGYAVYSVHRIGSYYFMVCWKATPGEYWLCRVSSTWTGFTALTKIGSGTGYATPAVGPDLRNGNVLVAGQESTTNFRVWAYNTSGVLQTNQSWGINWGLSSVSTCASVGIGPVGLNGEDKLWVGLAAGVRILDLTTRELDWTPGKVSGGAKGMCFEVNGKLRYLGYNTYRVYEFVQETNWGEASIVDVKYSWYDSDSGGSGKHETTPSPSTSAAAWKWAALQVDTPAVSDTGQNDSPDSVAIYLDNKRCPDVPVGQSSNIIRSINTSGAAAKTSNEFAGATAFPGAIKSKATLPDAVTPRIWLKGDGTGNWGDLTVNGAGKAVIGGDTGWLDVTVFASGWENFGSGYRTVQYRRIGSQVHFRGMILGPGGGATGRMFTLPVGFRPVLRTILTAPSAGMVGDVFQATGDGTKQTTSVGTGTGGTAHRHEVTYNITTSVSLADIGARIDVMDVGEVHLITAAVGRASVSWISLAGVSFWID